MSLSEFDQLMPSKEEGLFKQPEITNNDDSSIFKEGNDLLSNDGDGMFKQSELLPVNEDSLFKQPDNDSQLQFPSFDLPDFSHFPIEDGNFGDLEFLDLASDRFLSKSKHMSQYSDIYFNSLATPSGYCSANYLTEEANRLSLLLSESGERDKGEALDKSLIENLEELFGVGSGGTGNSNQNGTLDEQLPNVMESLNERSKSSYNMEFQVPNDVLNLMAKNLENLEDLGKKELSSTSDTSVVETESHQQSLNEPQQQWKRLEPLTAKIASNIPQHHIPLHKTITIKSLTPFTNDEPPAGAIAKIILRSSKKNNKTKIIFSSIDDKEQHSFTLNTSDMRRAAQMIKYYNLDNMESLRRLLQLGPLTSSGTNKLINSSASQKNTSFPTKQHSKDKTSQKSGTFVQQPQLNDGTVWTPAVSPIHSPLSERGKDEADKSLEDQDELIVGGSGKGEVDGVDESSLEICHKHEKSCRLAEKELARVGIKSRIIEVKLGNDSYYCCPEEKCQKAFLSLSELKIHVLKHYNIKPFQCEEAGCLWSFYSKAKLNRHMKSHSKEKDFQCIYNDCGKKFSNKYNLSVHLKSHGRVLEYSCSLCEEKFHTNGKLELHISKAHSESANPRYICDYPGCRYTCFVRNHLISHTKIHTAQTYTCDKIGCSKQFRTIELLQRHIDKHSEVKEYICDMTGCGIKFQSSSKLSRHKRVVHTRTASVQCDVCHRIFSRSDHLNTHRASQHSSVSEKVLRCLVHTCEKRFASRQLLLAHVRKVHKKNERTGTLTCPFAECQQRFVSRATFESHLASHGETTEIETHQDAKDNTNLDFVALLSSVGEDILLPDELSCPEYEIRTEMNRSLVHDTSMDTASCHSPVPESASNGINTNQQSYVVPEITPGAQIFISIPQVDLNTDLPNTQFQRIEAMHFSPHPSYQKPDLHYIKTNEQTNHISSLSPQRHEQIHVLSLDQSIHMSGGHRNDSHDMTEILIDNITIPDEMIPYDNDSSVIDVDADGDINNHGDVAFDHIEQTELDSNQQPVQYHQTQIISKQAFQVQMNENDGGNNSFNNTEDVIENYTASKNQLIAMEDEETHLTGLHIHLEDLDNHIQVAKVTNNKEVNESFEEVNGLEVDPDHILISQIDDDMDNTITEETISEIHSDISINHSTINLQDLK